VLPMSMIDLEAEMSAAGRAVRQPHLDRLRALGVSNATMAAAGEAHWPFGVAHAEPAGDGLFQPGVGALHVLLPVLEDGALVDVVAFRPASPHDWLLRTGNAFALGLQRGLGWWTWHSPADPDAVPPRHQVGRPVHLYSHPLDWLRGGCDGLAILDWDSPDIIQLNVLEQVTVSEPHIARLLTAALTRPARVPHIELKEFADAA
jgi:hypothetical protein